jgi:hypothetical protein
MILVQVQNDREAENKFSTHNVTNVGSILYLKIIGTGTCVMKPWRSAEAVVAFHQ